MTTYLIIAGIGVALLALFGLVSYVLWPKIPDLRGMIGGGGGDLESFEGAPVDNTEKILDGLKSMMEDRENKAFWRSIFTGVIFYLLGAVTTVYGDPVVKLLQAAAIG